MMVLNGCRRAHGAGYQHGNRSGCLKKTRESVLNEIEKWTEDFDRPPVFRLNGLAGTGKSSPTAIWERHSSARGALRIAVIFNSSSPRWHSNSRKHTLISGPLSFLSNPILMSFMSHFRVRCKSSSSNHSSLQIFRP